jgi:hypothetical protein
LVSPSPAYPAPSTWVWLFLGTGAAAPFQNVCTFCHLCWKLSSLKSTWLNFFSSFKSLVKFSVQALPKWEITISPSQWHLPVQPPCSQTSLLSPQSLSLSNNLCVLSVILPRM